MGVAEGSESCRLNRIKLHTAPISYITDFDAWNIG